MNRKSAGYSQMLRNRKDLQRLMEEMGSMVVMVEGKKDSEAIQRYVVSVIEVSGRTRIACERAARSGAAEVAVLTDFDERGKELAEELNSELRSRGVKPNLTIRRRMGKLLGITRIENFERRYREMLDETRAL